MSDATQQELTEARINIGILQAQVGHLTQGMSDLQESNKQLTAKLDQVLLALSEARGGWRTLMLVGGAASTAGGALTWVIQHFAKA
jgi:prefoldin subunit 5